MQQIPVQSVPVQNLKVVLGGQNCELLIYQKTQGLFVDVSANGVAVVNATIARDSVPLVSRNYVGFLGNVLFIDTQGNDDPFYTGIGSRFTLVYLMDAEYATIV